VLFSPDHGCRAVVVDNNPCCLPDDSSILFDENTSVGQSVGHVANSGVSNMSLECYTEFVSDGDVSCANSDLTKSVVILRDTGASQTLMLNRILPELRCESDGSCVVISGIGSGFMSVPLRHACVF
jgi:hypothetical protein